MNKVSIFWTSVPRKSLVGFLIGVFLFFATTGVAGDVINLGRQPKVLYAMAVLLSGFFAVLYAFSGYRLRRNFWKAFIPLLLLQVLCMTLLANLFPEQHYLNAVPPSEFSELQERMLFDGWAVVSAIALGYPCFVYVMITEARRHARIQAEMTLAAEIHRGLVPAIDTHIGPFEFCGRSIPSGEVGGDLVDLYEHQSDWIAYIGDVSGHGVAPGVVMGMVKSAARMQLSSAEKCGVLLERLNSVLCPIKKPEMFVTFAYLAMTDGQMQYATAGHPPILHYHAASSRISELTCSNFPVGLLPGKQFSSAHVSPLPGDLFLLFTDGLTECANAKDEEFGLPALKELFASHAEGPLNQTVDAIVAAINRHGHAEDDRSLLMVRFSKLPSVDV